ncbi:MAG: hypothetical protein Q605_AUC00998G0001, partial [Actinomyces urogenitalis DORA_12]
NAPDGTRAAVRGAAVAQVPQVGGASWTSLVLDLPGRQELARLSLPGDVVMAPAQARELIELLRATVSDSIGRLDASEGQSRP